MEKNKFYKLIIIAAFIVLTIIWFACNSFGIIIDWNMLATIGGFIGVIMTIIVTENTRIKQNEYEYKIEKIKEEQNEFKHVLKEKIDLLDFSNIMNSLVYVDSDNYLEINMIIHEYRAKLLRINYDLLWYYPSGEDYCKKELILLIDKISLMTKIYNEALDEYSKLIFNFNTIKILGNYAQMEELGGLSCEMIKEIEEYRKNNKTEIEIYDEIKQNQFEILNRIMKCRNDYILQLYDQAQLVLAEREKIVNDIINE